MRKSIGISLVLLIVISIGVTIGIFFLVRTLLNEEVHNRIQFNVNGKIFDDFGYWLQDIDIESVKESKYDLIIIDYSSDGTDSGEFSGSEVKFHHRLFARGWGFLSGSLLLSPGGIRRPGPERTGSQTPSPADNCGVPPRKLRCSPSPLAS